jgi:glycosyltransferase involved in cell wall biosynthesis
MRAAVVTPYYNEPIEVLKRCHDSVLAQTHADTFHVMVSDGAPCDEIDSWSNVVHIRSSHNGDYGDTPRAIGALIASAKGADAITLLDADNWFDPDHVEKLSGLQRQTNAQVVTGTRTLIRMDGSVMGVCNESDGRNFNDTNCYLIMKDAFPVFGAWGFKDPKHGIVGDRIFWNAIQRMGYRRSHCMEPTVNYMTSFAFHYQVYNEPIPEGAKIIVNLNGEQTMMLWVDYQKMLAPKNPPQPILDESGFSSGIGIG